MECLVCKKSESYIDDRLGERVCLDCGYVMVSNIIEETVSPNLPNEEYRLGDRGTLGSHISNLGNPSLVRNLKRTQKIFSKRNDSNLVKGQMECNMVLSPWLPNNNLKDRVHSYYRRFYSDRYTWRFTISVRATAIVFLVLRENGIPISLAKLAIDNNEDKFRVSKAVRYFARQINKPWLLHQVPIDSWTDKIAQDLFKNVKTQREMTSTSFRYDLRLVTQYISQVLSDRGVYFSKGHMASCVWITCLLRTTGSWPEFNQAQIASSCECGTLTIRNNNNSIYNMLAVDKKMLKALTVKKFVAGVRYD